jgi:hypothetical protein
MIVKKIPDPYLNLPLYEDIKNEDASIMVSQHINPSGGYGRFCKIFYKIYISQDFIQHLTGTRTNNQNQIEQLIDDLIFSTTSYPNKFNSAQQADLAIQEFLKAQNIKIVDEHLNIFV